LKGAKFSLLLMIGFIITMIGCDEKKKTVPQAEERMKKNNAVSIATYPFSAPFVFGKDTGVQGLDVDIGTEIGKALGYEVKWIKALDKYEQLFDYLRNGDAEIVISAVAMEDRMKNEFSFSHPYYDSWDIMAIQRTKLDIKGLNDLSGKNVGVAAGRPGDAFMSLKKSLSIKKYSTLDDALGGLNRTEVDAVVGDEPFLSYSNESYPNTNMLQEKVNTYQYAVVVRKTDSKLLSKINETIDRMKASGEMEKRFNVWMQDRREKAKARLTGDVNKEQMRNSAKKIKVTVNKTSGDWNPDRLDGFKLVLEGATGRFESSRILMDGNKGHCDFATPVPPGDYTLIISILGIKVKVTVPRLEKNALAMDLNIGRGASILLR
jgi:ABC-type amino acid transport substrate-binding protein